MNEAIQRFVEAFNAGRYFEAHEILEERWLPAPDGPERSTLRGLIQIAAAFEKLKRGEPVGFTRLLPKGLGNLEAAPSVRFHGLDLAVLRVDVTVWLEQLRQDGESVFGKGPTLRLF